MALVLNFMVKKAVIIAAGNGSRLASKKNSLPKPLRKVSGLPLIKRIILTAKKGGISEFIIVVGYQKEKIIKALNGEEMGVKIEFVENREWEKPNGLSVLCAKPFIRENFVLLMSDHIFDYHTLEKMLELPMGNNRGVLAVDSKIGTIFDLDDATKVLSEKSQILSIGKSLAQYNAIDAGMFLLSPEFFDVLEESKKNGGPSLSEGIQCLANRGQMGTFDVGSAFWHDIDTLPSLKNAEKKLSEACRKPTDGTISRYFNRHLSLFFSRFLVKTPLTANQMTGITTFIGILAGFLTSHGDYWSVAAGGILFKLTSILDGVDGEMSKLKMTDSKVGQWLDTLSDNLTYLFYIIGVIFGLNQQAFPHLRQTGTLTLFGVCMTLFVMFFYLIRHTNSGSLVEIQKDFEQKVEGASGFKKFLGSTQFMMKRDFFALLFMILALAGELKLILWLSLVGSNVTWMVLLSSRLGLWKPSMVVKESADIVSQ